MGDILKIWRFVKIYTFNYRRLFYISFGVLLFGTALQLPIPLLYKNIIDNVLPRQQVSILWKIIIAILAVALIRESANFIQRYLMAAIKAKVAWALKVDLAYVIWRSDLAGLRRLGTTNYLGSRIYQDVESLDEILTSTFLFLMKTALIFLFGLVVLIYLSPKLTFISVLLLPVHCLIYIYWGNRIKVEQRGLRQSHAEAQENLLESLEGLETISAYNIYERMKNRLNVVFDKLAKAEIRFARASGLYSSSSGLLGDIAPLLIMGIGTYEAMQGRLTIGGIIVFLSLINYLFVPVDNLSSIGMEIKEGAATIERLEEIFRLKDRRPVEGTKLLPAGPRRILFEKVSFGYSPGQLILNGLNFAIEPGSKVALVGKNGSGKSTVLRLLLRFYEPQSGRILLDGNDLKEYCLDKTRQAISVAFQESYLFSETVASNITLGQESDRQYFELIVSHLGLDGLLDKRITEGGKNISAGERQKIILARALYKRSDIVLLDEVTAHIDATMERNIWQNVLPLINTATTLIITHRPQAIAGLVDKIAVLDQGRISGYGDPTMLLQTNQLFKQLYQEEV